MTEPNSVGARFAWLLRVARERKSRHELAVAIALAAHVNGRTGTAWPSARTIADQCGLDLRHAWAALRRLRDAGLVHVAEPGGPGRSATYTLAGASHVDATQRAPGCNGALHLDATQRRTGMRRSVAPGCDAASHVGATEHGVNAELTRSEHGVRAVSRARSASAARAARRAHSKKPKPKPF